MASPQDIDVDVLSIQIRRERILLHFRVEGMLSSPASQNIRGLPAEADVRLVQEKLSRNAVWEGQACQEVLRVEGFRKCLRPWVLLCLGELRHCLACHTARDTPQQERSLSTIFALSSAQPFGAQGSSN